MKINTNKPFTTSQISNEKPNVGMIMAFKK